MIYYPSKYSTFTGVRVEIVTGRSTSFQLVGLPPTDSKGTVLKVRPSTLTVLYCTVLDTVHCTLYTVLKVRPSSVVRDQRGTGEQFRLGLVTSKSADHSGLLTYQADVYNLVERVKLVEVSEAGGWRLTWTLAGGERQEVRKEKTKTYRESDRNLLRRITGRGRVGIYY